MHEPIVDIQVAPPVALPSVTETLILSDVHLGLPACRAAALLETLKRWRFQRLILLGDIFHDLDFRRLNAEHWDLLSHVRKLSNPKRRVEVVWVLGNHDRVAAKVASHLMGVDVCETFAWEAHGRRHVAVHGDRFDRLITNHPFLSDVGARLLAASQRWLRVGPSGVGWMDRRHNRWLGLTAKVRSGAKVMAADRGIDVVFCGHTHEALHEKLSVGAGSVEYVNTGCWTRRPSHYATVDAAGVRLHACR
ncbi:MAG: metallophosphoesterase [Pseudomonadota bacterium]